MKIESLLVNYLFTNKKLSLQGIGTFTVVGNIQQPDGDSPVELPENAVVFDQDLHAPLDEGMIQYIVESTRKIKPLATSDLESFSLLTKEYLNIGKPLLLEGLGTLQKNRDGKFEFFSSKFIHPRVEYSGKEIKEKEPGEISFTTPPRNNSTSKSLIFGGILLLVLFLVPALIYYYYKDEPKPEIAEENMISPTTVDTVAIQTPTPVVVPVTDTLRYLVIKTFSDSTRANNETKKLISYNHSVQQRTKDSTHYVVMPFSKMIQDTTRIKDSINRFFGVKSWFLPE